MVESAPAGGIGIAGFEAAQLTPSAGDFEMPGADNKLSKTIESELISMGDWSAFVTLASERIIVVPCALNSCSADSWATRNAGDLG